MAENEEIMKKKEILFRGKSILELKALDTRESAKFLPSRSRRAVLKHFDVIEKFLRRCDKKILRNKKIKTHLRDLVIVPKMVGLNIQIHNGKSFQDVLITIEMIGHRLGEFAQTRSRVNHGSAGIGATKSSRAAKK
nr:30S ribosomal protein S19 [uncultured archaeon]